MDPTPQSAAPEGTAGYAALIERAAAFVRQQGGSVPEDRLIAYVFGSNGSAGLWRPLLHRVLGDSAVLEQRGDGWWAIAGQDVSSNGGASLLTEFVALDVETTGLRPLHQRIIEVAALRYRDGVVEARFETLCNPGRRIPDYVAKLTGITDATVADAPQFAAIAKDLVDFIGPSLVVGHNVAFDLSFVNAELKRLRRVPLLNERLDVMGLAVRLLPEVRKPSLERVATALGLAPRRLHRAAADAELTAEAGMRLVARAQQDGVTSLAELRAASAMIRRPRDDVGRGRAVLDRSLLADVPHAPGVYRMRDAYDDVIYVGKAKDLRDRLSSYYSQPLGYTRKMDGLLEAIARIEVEVVGSELEALLLESQLIKRYQPRYNTALRSFEHYPYIRVDVSAAWPRVTLVKSRKDDGARYFGPFRTKTGAQKTVDLINRLVPLRTCTRTFKTARSYGSPCIQLDLGRCLGPCVGRADRGEYLALVHDVVDFLDGQDEALYERLWQELEASAARLDYERAAKLRDDLRTARYLVAEQRQLRESEAAHTLLLVLPSADPAAREVLLIVRGRLWGQYRAARADGAADLAQRLAAAWARLATADVPWLDHAAVDEANILNRWLFRYAGHPAILSLPSLPAEPAWPALASAALALEDETLRFAEPPSPPNSLSQCWERGSPSSDPLPALGEGGPKGAG